MDKVYFFIHCHGVFANNINYSDQSQNFRVLYYECINSQLILYKTNLELLYRITYNHVNKKILAVFFIWP